MLCVVYRCRQKLDTYLYLPHGASFDELPESLQQLSAGATQVLTVNLAKPRNLARMTSVELVQRLTEQGYYVQLPPASENLLDTLPKSKAKE